MSAGRTRGSSSVALRASVSGAAARDASAFEDGAVYIYRFMADGYQLAQKLTRPGTSLPSSLGDGDRFGAGVVAEGLVGGPLLSTADMINTSCYGLATSERLSVRAIMENHYRSVLSRLVVPAPSDPARQGMHTYPKRLAMMRYLLQHHAKFRQTATEGVTAAEGATATGAAAAVQGAEGR